MSHWNKPLSKLELAKERWKQLLKPHEYQILLPSIWVGILVEVILNRNWINIRDIPTEFLSETVIYAWFVTTILSAGYKFSTWKIGDVSSRAKADNIVLEIQRSWNKLRSICNTLYRNGENQELIKDTAKTKKNQLELKYTYLAMTLLSSHIIRWEVGPCHDCFKEVCDKWWRDDTAYTMEDTKQNRYYKKIFKRAIKHLVNEENYKDPIVGDSRHLIVEVINTLEDFYETQFTDFCNEVGCPFSTMEEGNATAERTNVAKDETLDFLKEQARNHKAFFYLLLSLSAASLGKYEWVKILEWISETPLEDILDFLASHANSIVGTTVVYTSVRAIWTLNSNNILTRYISKRLAPDTLRIQLEDKE